jgi:hypothetical protein
MEGKYVEYELERSVDCSKARRERECFGKKRKKNTHKKKKKKKEKRRGCAAVMCYR